MSNISNITITHFQFDVMLKSSLYNNIENKQYKQKVVVLLGHVFIVAEMSFSFKIASIEQL